MLGKWTRGSIIHLICVDIILIEKEKKKADGLFICNFVRFATFFFLSFFMFYFMDSFFKRIVTYYEYCYYMFAGFFFICLCVI